MSRQDKKEKKKVDKELIGIIIFCCADSAIIIISLLFYINFCIEKPFMPKPWFVLILIFFLAILMPLSVWLYFENKRMDDIYNRYEERLLRGGKERSKSQTQGTEEKEIEQESKDVISDMLKNNAEIIEYFKITKGQERVSYWFSVTCSIVGVIILGYSVYAALESKNIGFTVTTVISGAITEVVSGIILWIHNKSAMQLNYYYDALHENEKFLSAINLADKLGEDNKELIYIKIIEAQIRENKKIEKSS